MKSLHGFLAGLMAIAGFATAQPASGAEKWKHYSVVAATHGFNKVLISAFDRIDKKTNGQLKIELVPYGQTPHKATEALQVLQDGLVQMTEWLPAFTTGTHPILGAPGLPFLLPELRDTTETVAAADRAWATATMKQQISAIVAKHGGTAIGSYYYEPMNFYFAKPISQLGDLAGRRIRVFSPEQANLVKELGATPISLTAADVYSALQRGLLDGVITSSGGITDLKWHEQLNASLTTNLMMVRTDVLVSSNALNKLPAAHRAMLEEEIATVSKELRRYIIESDPRHHETMRKMGFTMGTSQGAMYQQLRDLSREKVWPQWSKAAGPDAPKVLAEITDAMLRR